MEDYNKLIVERLWYGPYTFDLYRSAAHIIEKKTSEISCLEQDFQEALEISKLSISTLKVVADRIIELEKALRYVHDNPHAHPENVKWVVKDALGIKGY